MALPIYEMLINPDETSDVEVSFVALVDKPAIERNFMMFKSLLLNFAVDDDKRIISGPAMVADTPIYRRDESGEFNVFFSAATIKEIALKFAKKGYAKNLNLFHDPNLPADGVTIFNSFVSDKSIGIPAMTGFEDLPDGTWFISAKVENEEIWQKIKAGEVRGFSVEGNFSIKKSGTLSENEHLIESGIMSDIKRMLSDVHSFLFNTNPAPAPTPAPIVPAAAAATTAKLKDGTEVSISALEVGGTVMVGDAPAPAGEHEMEDGSKVTVGEGGVITAITPKEVPGMSTQTPEQQMQAVKAAVQKFAVGSPEERMANLETVAKALMEYSFGWQIREVQEKALRDQAIEVYKTGFEDHKKKLAEAQEKIESQGKVIKSLFAIVEKLAEAPTADPASTSGNNFQSQASKDKEARFKELQENIKKLKTA